VSLRELLSPLWRQRKVLVATFVVACSAAVASAFLLSKPSYDAEMLMLLRRERVDPLVTPDREARTAQVDVSESDLLSEIELLKSSDLLEQVALDADLVPRSLDPQARPQRAASEASALRSALDINPVRRTTMIHVVYRASDPVRASAVLRALAARYPEKHLAAHRSIGAQEFFAEQSRRSEEQLHEAQAKLMEFSAREHVTDPTEEKTALLQQMATFDATLEQTRAAAADAQRRLSTLQSQLASTPGRQVTSVSTGANSGLVSDLTGKILQLELQCDELARKFTPQYPPLMQLETQLTRTREALSQAKGAPILNETSDRNPTYAWLDTEAARVCSECDALQARAAAITQTLQRFRERSATLEAQSQAHQQLLRDVKIAEEDYLLYQRKQEESRIADALDRTRITNVTVVDGPTVPKAPSQSRRWLILLTGLPAALLLAFAAAYAVDWWRPSFGSARDVEEVLKVPVLAHVRRSGR